MLSGIHPILSGVLLAALDHLGHGDEFVVVDANYPAYQSGQTVVEVAGVPAPDVVSAIRTLVPLDSHEGHSAILMTPAKGELARVQRELVEAAEVAADRVDGCERFAFYDRAAGAGLIVRTGELRPYGNLIMRKGVINSYHSPGAAR